MFRQLNAVLAIMNVSSSPFSTAALFVATSAWQTVTKECCRMKKSLVCALLAMTMTLGGAALYAQDTMGQGGPGGGHHMMSADQQLEHMTQMLNLTADQQQKIKPILENQQTQMQALHQDTSMSQADRRSKMMQIHQNTQQQIGAVLTPEQQQKWQQMQEQHREHMGHGGMGQAPPQQ